METELVAPMTSITGKVNDVNAPIVAGAIFPTLKTVRLISTPTLVNAGAVRVVEDCSRVYFVFHFIFI